MKRHLFNAFALLCFTLALAIAALWVRSYWRPVHVRSHAGWCGPDAIVWHGVCLITWAWPPPPRIGWSTEPSDQMIRFGLRGLWWFGYSRTDHDRLDDHGLPVTGPHLVLHTLTLPAWVLAAPCVVLPVGWLARKGRESRRRVWGRCPACGYDLRGTPAGGACPECGATSRGLPNT